MFAIQVVTSVVRTLDSKLFTNQQIKPRPGNSNKISVKTANDALKKQGLTHTYISLNFVFEKVNDLEKIALFWRA